MLADTSIFVRLANAADPARPTAERAIAALHARGQSLVITPQVVIEFWAVVTRPIAVNGLGLTAAQAEQKVAVFEATTSLLADKSEIFARWRALVTSFGVCGKQVHDARLVATCQVHEVDYILTFNVGHFTRFAAAQPTVSVIDPASL